MLWQPQDYEFDSQKKHTDKLHILNVAWLTHVLLISLSCICVYHWVQI